MTSEISSSSGDKRMLGRSKKSATLRHFPTSYGIRPKVRATTKKVHTQEVSRKKCEC